jgi:tripartite-type tricarboxylate transporter receptor subunit TctC
MSRFLTATKTTLLTLGLAAAMAAAAAYPERPIKLIVPFPAGGAGDTIARIVAARMSETLKQQVVVDFKAGAATILGADSVAHAEPDGYTLLLGTATTFVVNPIIYRKLPYSAQTSFDPVGIIGSNPLALLVNSAVPATTLKDTISLIRAKPTDYSFGSHGSGSTVHFAGEMLWAAADVKVLHVPYKGSAPAMTDLMSGQIPLLFDSVPAAVAAAKGGRVRIIATTGKSRSALIPNTPTITESGYPNVSLEAWWAVVGPKGLATDVKTTLSKAFAEAMADKGVQEKLANVGFDVKYGAPAVYFELVKEDTAKLAPIAKANNIQQD